MCVCVLPQKVLTKRLVNGAITPKNASEKYRGYNYTSVLGVIIPITSQFYIGCIGVITPYMRGYFTSPWLPSAVRCRRWPLFQLTQMILKHGLLSKLS